MLELKLQNHFNIKHCATIFPFKLATLKNMTKLAAVAREIQDEHPWNHQSRNTAVPNIDEDYSIQVSEEIEGRMTNELSQELSRTES